MFNPKDQELLNRLIEASGPEGKCEWLPTAYSNIFMSSVMGKYSFQILQDKLFGPDDESYRLTIFDKDGAEIHSVNFTDYAELKALFDLARRRALKIDNTIDDILGNLA
jgi:hypothetical protein